MKKAMVAVVALLMLLAGCGGGDGEAPDGQETAAETSPADAETATEPAAGMANPASVYCAEQGGTEETREDAEGNQAGVCVFPDGSECDSWAYFRKECAPGDQPAG